MQVEQDRTMRSGAAPYPAPFGKSGVSAAAAITVMIASDRTALNTMLLSMLACESGIEIAGEPVMDSSRLATCVEHHLPGVLMLDKTLLDGLDPQSLRRIRAHCGHVRVLLLWDEICQGLVADVLRNRFHGFLLTTCLPEVCLKAVRTVSKGELWLSRASLAMAIDDLPGLSDHGDPGDPGATAGAPHDAALQTLTPRELQVVALLRRGCINKEIARELGIKEDTVKKHLQSVFAKLGVHRRALVALRPMQGWMQTRGAIETKQDSLDRSRVSARSASGFPLG